MSPLFRRRPPARPPEPPADETTRIIRADEPLAEDRWVEEEVVEERLDPVYEEPPPRPIIWPWLLLLLLIVLGGIAAYVLLARDDGGDDGRTVPGVVRLPEREAVDRLDDEGFDVRVRRQATGRAPRGIVFGQRPGAGRELAEGSPVTILVSQGVVRTSVPNVVGLPRAQAGERLEGAGLRPRERRVFSEEPRGVVIAQDPRAGERVLRDTAVRINVSKGTGRVAVPDVVGRDADDAGSIIRRAGLVARPFDVSAAEPSGTVVSQNPPAGSEVARGDVVRINVSTGEGAEQQEPRDVEVPSVVGRPLARAQRELQAAGFVVRVNVVPSGEPEGTVVAQNPTGGVARRGSSVGLDVSEGPRPPAREPVPDVVGLTQAEASSELRAAGFRVTVFREATPDPAEEGVVIRQEPAAARQAPRGSTVTVYVGVP